MTKLRNLFGWVLLALCLAASSGSVVLAQELPAWQAANDIDRTMLEAQKKLLADPAASSEAAAFIEAAKAQYGRTLQPDLVTLAPEADRAISQALAEARDAALSGEAARLAAARGRAWTNILRGSYEATLAALAGGDAQTASGWLQLREYRQATRVTVVENAATRAMAGLAAGRIEPAEALAVTGSDLRDTYFFRLREALHKVEEASGNGLTTRAAEWAGQGRGYAGLLQADMAARLGEVEAERVVETLANLEQAVLAADGAAVSSHLQAARSLLAGYTPLELDPAGIARRGQLLYLFTDLVYVEYKDGVRNGRITIPIEYQEAVTFRDQAEAIFEELRPVMAANDGPAAERFARLLAELETIIAGLGEPEAVKVRVEEGLGIIEATLKVSGDDGGTSLPVITTLLGDVVTAVRDGRYQDAERSRLEAYAMFENGMEQRLANRAITLSRELEGLFWEGSGGRKGLATLLREQAPPAEVQAGVTLLSAKLVEGQDLLAAGLTGTLAALNSLAIIIREGLEAVLIIGAVLGYLRATRAPGKYSLWVYLGVIAAILLSLLTWVAASSLLTISVANRELLEGVTSLVAVAVLFYVTNWLFHKVYVVDWLTFIKEQVGQALSSGSALALAALGFTVVYREGFETVLFYQALLFDAETGWVLLGFGLGLAIILAVAYVMLRLSQRLPLKPFFTATGGLLLLLAFSLTGKGVRELQEAGVIGATLLSWLPENLVLIELFGLFPTLETTVAQAGLITAVAVTFAISRRQGQQKVAAAATSSSH